MAITITDRPRRIAFTSDSPAVSVYSNWNAVWNPFGYTFAVLSSDVLSSLVIKIFEVGSNTLLASNTVRPFKAGSWFVSIDPYIRSYLLSDYSADFTSFDNYIDAGNALNFYITYDQIFDDGSDTLFNSEQTKPITAMCSAMQFGDTNGGNMIEYVPFNTDLSEGSKMKFLTKFERPVMWTGYPFSLSFIYSLEIQGVQIIKREIQQNINRGSLQTTNTNLNPLEIGQVNYLKVREPNQLYAKSVLLSIRTEGEVIDNNYVNEGYVDEGYTQIQ